jgi:hypothetical protein
MKKTLLFLAAISMAVAANAKILRVSNVTGSSAPYSTIEAAHDAASAGDTIMVDGSNTSYGDITITKRLVLIGPGFWLVNNGIIEEGSSTASLGTVNIKSSQTVLKGLTITMAIQIRATNVVINRCHLSRITFFTGADNAVISQNYITRAISKDSYASVTNYHQITNNIITYIESNHNYSIVGGISNSNIAYNTFRDATAKIGVTNSTIEHNLWKSFVDHGSNNSVNNNGETEIISLQATNDFIDSDYYKLEIPEEVTSQYGAFAGDSPYILSGVPSGPVIQDLVVPTTVEMGTKMNVTIKVGMVK